MKKGFTLIELMLVMTIIAILVSVIMIALNASRNRAITASLKSSLKSIYASAMQCRDVNSALIGNGSFASGTSICSSALIAGSFPQSEECGAAAIDTVYAITNPGNDNWQITLSTCTKSNLCTGAANAYCDAGGCHFPAAGTCK